MGERNRSVCVSTSLSSSFVPVHAEKSTILFSDVALNTLLQLLKKEVSDHSRHLNQYFQVFLNYANKGPYEVLRRPGIQVHMYMYLAYRCLDKHFKFMVCTCSRHCVHVSMDCILPYQILSVIHCVHILVHTDMFCTFEAGTNIVVSIMHIPLTFIM